MALILAINPGNSHSPTLARLARELPGHELVGADSCAVAIAAIRSRVPDLVLLPDKSARGEAELLAQLRTIRGGVPTRKLPPVSSADPAALAKEIRTILTREPKPAVAAAPPVAPVAPSPHLLAAAAAAITWVHARRTQWAAEGVAVVEVEEAARAAEPNEPYELNEPYEPYEPNQSHELDEPPGSRANWFVRGAVLVAILTATGSGVYFWPRMRATTLDPVASVSPSPEIAPATEPGMHLPLDPELPAAVPPDATAARPETVEPVSGWVAVSTPFNVTITRGTEAVLLDERGRVILEPGRHRLRFRNPDLGYDETRTVDVRPAGTTTVNLTPDTTISVTATEPSEVFIDGTRAGDTPFEGRVRLGSRNVTVRGPGGERQFIMNVTMKPVQLEVDFSKP